MTGRGLGFAAVLLVALLLAADAASGRSEPAPPPSEASPEPAGPASTTAPLISRVFSAAPRGDEFIEVWNPDGTAVDLTGWVLSDGEGTARFPNGTRLPPDGRLVATRNATSYAEDVLASADFTWDAGDAAAMEGTGLRLADAGDEVLLLNATGGVVDAFAYGGSAYAGPGWTGRAATAPGRGEIAVRRASGDILDRDNASDWEGVRTFRLGQSAFDPAAIALDGPVRVLVSPDDGAAPLLAFLASARISIEVAVYTLTSDAIGATLADAARRGVHVRLLLEAAPVGGVDEAEGRIALALAAAGAEVRWLATGKDVVKRYAYLHAKYAVVDGEAALVSSENFGPAAFPEDGASGNRGWSVAVRDPQIASQLRDVFDEDFNPRRRDTEAAEPDASMDLGAPPAVPPWTWPEAECCPEARLLVGPDNLLDPEALVGLLDGARYRLWIEAFYVEDPWGPWPNPFLEAALRAAGRGVEVRLLLDGGAWHAGDTGGGNQGIADTINARARAEGWPLEARLLAEGHAVRTVHNKGVLVDGRAALISSANWARGSATENREIGLWLEDPAVATRLERAFRDDWGDLAPMDGSAGVISDPAVLAGLYAFVAGASALSLRFLRPGDKGLKSGGRLERRGPARTPFRGRRREVRLLPAQLVAQPRPRARGRRGDRRGGEEARRGLRGPEGDRG